MRHRNIAAWMAAALCIGMLSLPASAAAEDFPTWAATAAQRWEDCGKLEESLSPEHVMTRGEVAVAIDRVMVYAAQAENASVDLSNDDPQAPALLRLVAAGVLQGNGAGQLLPRAPVTRQEAAVMVARAFDLAGEWDGSYSDWGQVATWAQPAVSAVTKAGLMQGDQGLFRPQAQITYAETIKLLTTAVEGEGFSTGLTVRLRSEEGVLAQGQPEQVNDGKFEIESVTETEEGYHIALRGLEALEGEEADANGAGSPRTAGKWMGLQLQFGGLVQADKLEYSRDGESWDTVESNAALAEGYRLDSVLAYFNGAGEASAQADEVEKTSSLTFRLWTGGEGHTITIHYTPADVEA